MAAAVTGRRDELASDVELAQRLAQGDKEAFCQFYEAYFPRVYGFVQKKLSNRADTEEVVQDVFLNIFLSIDSFRGEAPLAAWVFGVSRRTISRRFSRKRPLTQPLPEEDCLGDSPRKSPVATPEETVAYRERLTAMSEAADNQLSQEQWGVFWDHHMEGQSVRSIAQRLGKSEDAVKSNLYRTRRTLLAT